MPDSTGKNSDGCAAKQSLRALVREYTYVVDDLVEEFLYRGLPDYIKKQKLVSIGRSELSAALELRLSKGKDPAALYWTRRRIHKAIVRFVEAKLKSRGDSGLYSSQFLRPGRTNRTSATGRSLLAGGARRPSEPYRSVVLNPDECSLPQLSQEALRRIDVAKEKATHSLKQGSRAYVEQLKADPSLTKGFPPAVRIKQMFDAFTKSIAECQADEYFRATGKEQSSRWRESLCKSVFSEVAQTSLYLSSCIAFYKGIEDLQAVVEAAVDGVIEGTAGWREEMTRREKLSWFKGRNQLGRQNHRVYLMANVDRKTFWLWMTDRLPDSARPSKRIASVLKTGLCHS